MNALIKGTDNAAMIGNWLLDKCKKYKIAIDWCHLHVRHCLLLLL